MKGWQRIACTAGILALCLPAIAQREDSLISLPEAIFPPGKESVTSQPSPTLRLDSSEVTVRLPDVERLEALRQDPDFQYEVELVDQSFFQSLWRAFWDWLFDKVPINFNSKFWDRFWITFAILVVAYAVYRLFLNQGSGIFTRAADPGGAITFREENIHRVNFREEINRAIETGNFRWAVRLQYLFALKTLTDRGLIDWSPERTNRDYLSHLQRSALHLPFARLTHNFDYVFYGHFPVEETDYRSMARDFEEFRSRVEGAE
ncbi:MAG TPA: DUF4129 domain-containing protein [Calditrichia bacterium]|nr:DUF4129 domain-containing protein [Calditrichota bacterium]HQU72252.1 DUF4129 domain-containing protein [Calditrichia bacterium]HQV30985.1 DUF4129 domain-containing protein [Calditrichia bacterium]